LRGGVALEERLCQFAKVRWLWLVLAGACLSAGAAERADLVNPVIYRGMADASGAVAVSSNFFLAADDESNALRLYRADAPGAPVREYDFSQILEVDRKHVEADLEAGTRLGNRAFWIGSHGRNKNGRERPNRGCLFATDIRTTANGFEVTAVGRVYRDLLPDLDSDPRFAGFDLAAAALRAPKEPDALNIEGLVATPEGHLLIGFRNPIPQGKALLIPLLNPNELIEGRPPQFDAAIQLDLNGLGVRDIARWDNTYIIIAGPYDEKGKFELFKWNGYGSGPVRIKVNHLNRFHPEAIIIYPDKGLREFQILSDDGTLPVGGVPGKVVKDFTNKTFRGFWVLNRR